MTFGYMRNKKKKQVTGKNVNSGGKKTQISEKNVSKAIFDKTKIEAHSSHLGHTKFNSIYFNINSIFVQHF